MSKYEITSMDERFRGFLPVAIDIETGGFKPDTDAILELAGTLIKMNSDGWLYLGESYNFNIKPFEAQPTRVVTYPFEAQPPSPLRRSLL